MRKIIVNMPLLRGKESSLWEIRMQHVCQTIESVLQTADGLYLKGIHFCYAYIEGVYFNFEEGYILMVMEKMDVEIVKRFFHELTIQNEKEWLFLTFPKERQNK